MSNTIKMFLIKKVIKNLQIEIIYNSYICFKLWKTKIISTKHIKTHKSSELIHVI